MSLSSILSQHIHTLYSIEYIPTLSAPPDTALGEYCFGVFTLAKDVRRPPADIATEVAQHILKDTQHIVSANSVGGYVNIVCTSTVWIDILDGIKNTASPLIPLYPGREGEKNTIIVDYIGANIGKPLHIGHLCTPSIGQSIINIYRHLGYSVISDTHIGDWGLFGKLIAAHKMYGTPTGLADRGVEYLLDLYIRITQAADENPDIDAYVREEFRKLSTGDIENMALWWEFTSVSLAAMNSTLDMFHVHPDYDIGESFYEDLPLPKLGTQPPLAYTMNDIVRELLEKNIATKNADGSVAVVFPEDMKLPSVVIQKQNGTNLYLTADICAIRYRLTNGWNPSKMIYCVDLRQQMHFRQCFAICSMAGWTEHIDLVHAGNGHIWLADGVMSTRKWTIIRLEDLISEGYVRTRDILEKKWRIGEKSLSETDIREITVSAIKYSYLMQDRERNIVFDWDKALAFEGNSGPYIQYAYVRAKKISNQGVHTDTYVSEKFSVENDKYILSLYDTALIRTLADMNSTIQKVASTYKPHTLALYCYDLAVCFNAFYTHTPKILDEENVELRQVRLSLCSLVSQKLHIGFALLGMGMPGEM